MIYAYLIEDVRALSDLFKVGVGPKKSANGEFTAYRIKHPEFAARRALIVCGVPKSGLKKPMPASVGREIKVDTKDGQLFWYDGAGSKSEVDVLGVSSAPRIEQLIAPLPWREEADFDVPVVFWLHDADLMPEIVRRSLYLNNDRIQLARFEHDGKPAVLVRIEAPSYYLIAWCQEQSAERLNLFYPMTDGQGLYVQWGFEHPLSDLWRRALIDQSEMWLFFPENGERRTVPKPEWTSIYDLTDFEINLTDEVTWKQVSSEVDHFEIPLKLAPRHEPAPLEMIVLHEKERYRIENFLSLSDAKDLDKLEISAQQDDEGTHWYFVREKHRNDGVMLVELGGQGYSRYKGFDNLFLPTTLVLEPQLRRDQYKQLFELESSTLTFVVPEGELADAPRGVAAKNIKVRKRSFEPLSHFVDHIVHFEADNLYALLNESVFDLEDYKSAPSRPDLRKNRESNKSRTKNPQRANLPNKNKLQQDLKKNKPKLNRNKTRDNKKIQFEESKAQEETATPSELELLETDIERNIIIQGPMVELWQELMNIKYRRQKWLEASVCAIEGLWSLTFSEADLTPTTFEPETAKYFKQGFSNAITKAGGEPKELAVVSNLFGTQGTTDALTVVMQAAGQLRGIDAKLGKKVRWLAWRDVLSQTRDVRAQEEERESILDALNKKGLESHDVATFIRERILKDPDLEFAEDRIDGSGDTSYVLQNVEVIEAAIDSLQTLKIREASKASLARILAGMGLHARSRDLIGQSLEQMERSLNGDAPAGEGKAWHERLMSFLRTKPASGSNAPRPERWHVWVALNAWLVYKRVEPARAEEAKQAYDMMFAQLANYEKDELRRTAESLEARVGQSNVAEFLAVDTRSFFSSRELPDEMSKVIRGLKTAQKKSDEKNVNDLVLRGIKLASKELGESNAPSLETVARLILEMVEVLRKLKWDTEQRPVDQFESFVKGLPKEPASPESSRLYFAVLHCAATRALMDLGREKEAMGMLIDVLRWVGQDYMQVLDFVDLVKKEVLLAIELAPRNQRTEALRWLMNTLVQQEKLEIGDNPDQPGMGFEMPFQAYELIQMIDHTLEAAISNEKLVLRRLRDWEEREEMRMRYWIQRDQPAAAE